jgi:ribonuclease J
VTEQVRLVALGGLGEIGMNCMAIEHGDHRLLVDCGITFPEQPFGTDVIRPDFRYLVEERRAHQALWLTHGHEDHIGAVAYLLREHALPVYGPPYALALVRERLAENPPPREPSLITVQPGQRTQFGPFEAEAIRVTHSIADATSLALRTPAGIIVHTGDFKIDPHPSDHEHFDRARFAALGDEGVRLLLSDSTNIDSEGHAGSEQGVADSLARLVESARGRVVITLFASNTHRLRAVLELARRSGRKVCWLGRSVQTHARIGAEVGYLERADDLIITPQQAAELPRQRVLLAATGSQAERASALSRVAHRTHPTVALEPGDTVILSSRIIPGNDRPVIELIDALLRQGVQVIERRTDRSVHVSGHAHREEQRAMLELVRPRAFVPVHGTYHHLLRHAQLAREVGVRETLVAQNGDVLELEPERLQIVDRVSTGRVHVARGADVPEEVLADRSRLAESGAVALSLVIDRHGELIGQPELTGRGVNLPLDSREWLGQARLVVKREVRHAQADGLLGDPGQLRENLRRRLTRFMLESLQRRVVCLVTVHLVR